MPLIPINKEEYDMLVKSKEQIEAEESSRRRSQLVKKKRHGKALTLIPAPEGTTRGGKKSRRKTRKNIWVDPELVGSKPDVPSRAQRRRLVRSR